MKGMEKKGSARSKRMKECKEGHGSHRSSEVKLISVGRLVRAAACTIQGEG